MTDKEREAAIVRAGKMVEKHMAEFERSGCFSAHEDGLRAMRLMEALIRGRRAEQVARMEEQRGLA